MKPVLVPTSDVNSEHGVVVEWFVDDRAEVASGDPLVEIETSKAVLEVVAPAAGVLLRQAEKGREVALTDPVGLLFDDAAELIAYQERAAEEKAAAAAVAPTVRATDKAVQRARELGVDLSMLDNGGRLITVKEVEAAAALPASDADLPAPLTAPEGTQRVLLIGGGLGATQVMDIFAGGTGQAAVAIVDDSREKWGTDVGGVPVVGGTDRIAVLFKEGHFDAAVVAIGTSVAARRKFREACEAAGIPLANAIHPTVRISVGVRMGTGNVICAFCHFGTEAQVGENNFISAYNSYDHHSRLGSDIATGPGCMTSGLVTIGDRVRMGTGIFIEPNVELGDGVQVASGAIIVRSVPADHSVKTKIVTTTVVPQRP